MKRLTVLLLTVASVFSVPAPASARVLVLDGVPGDATAPDYRRIRSGSRWWLPASNVNASARLSDCRRPYEWSIVAGFDRAQVRHRGSGIFPHLNGDAATAGCVSAPR